MRKILSIVMLTMLLSTFVSFSHGGRTDGNGCHVDRKTGTRHCH
jgi:hypothetical protein